MSYSSDGLIFLQCQSLCGNFLHNPGLRDRKVLLDKGNAAVIPKIERLFFRIGLDSCFLDSILSAQ
ncbi:hypothetical protein P872_08930 [Rhodonellum psychrophilum GCM71 = DSM 17998]|uniref:Uncharacterized protein n=1 Tax=Rhodonellum psychrophilum GCM71 = DSM 17998 TaxID=1123057 RepID=U5BMV8_9BACT|nr:hypothetical protein P872_08930 [Rhodonellum psychrophilum GCM71 = DSM 17998]